MIYKQPFTNFLSFFFLTFGILPSKIILKLQCTYTCTHYNVLIHVLQYFNESTNIYTYKLEKRTRNLMLHDFTKFTR